MAHWIYCWQLYISGITIEHICRNTNDGLTNELILKFTNIAVISSILGSFFVCEGIAIYSLLTNDSSLTIKAYHIDFYLLTFLNCLMLVVLILALRRIRGIIKELAMFKESRKMVIMHFSVFTIFTASALLVNFNIANRFFDMLTGICDQIVYWFFAYLFIKFKDIEKIDDN